jgi:predicted membrane protein
MKMGAGLFWGLILIAIGLSIIFKVIFGISIGRIIIAVVLILIGIKILIGKRSFDFSSNENDVIFSERYVTEFPQSGKEFNTIFGKTVFNFSDAAIPTNKSLNLEFNTIFGSSELVLPPGLPVSIKAEAVFGSISLPNQNTAVFGSANYISDHDSSISKFVNIKANAVFGNMVIKQKRPSY